MSSTHTDSAPVPRLCHLTKSPDFNGYGFNLHAEKGKAGQFIGKVDAGSPSLAAGLREGDRIVEVNGTNIGNENHQQVVQRIKAVPNDVKLLVVDAEADLYFHNAKIVIRGDMPGVVALYSDKTKQQQSSERIDKAKDEEPVCINNNEVAPSPCARLCHVRMWPDFQGYGFNLHTEKGRASQFIGKVDADSPASAAGLIEGDRIIEVNGESVKGTDHQGVVTRIKSVPNETRLLVVDSEAEQYFNEHNIMIHSEMTALRYISCPETSSAVVSNGQVTRVDVNHSAPATPTPTPPPPQPPQENNRTSQQSEPEEINGEVGARDSVNEETSVDRVNDPVDLPREDSPEVQKDDEEDEEETVVVKVTEEQIHVSQEETSKPSEVTEELPREVSGEHEVPCEETPQVVDEVIVPQDEVMPREEKVIEPQEGVIHQEEVVLSQEEVEPVEEATVVTNEKDKIEETKSSPRHEAPVISSPTYQSSSTAPAAAPSQPVASSNGSDGLLFSGSVKEARERLARNKKRNHAKEAGLSSRDKYELFQQL